MRMTDHAERSPGCLSRLHVDQLLNGELADREDRQRHCAACPRCTALLAAHRRERAAFAVPRARAPRRWTVGIAAAAAVVGVWLVARPGHGGHDDEATRGKGKPALSFYVKHGEVVREGGPGEVVSPGDAINFTVSVDAPAFVAIVSIDGAGKVSVYYPDGATAAAIPAGRDQVLPRSVLLDDTLGVERVEAAFCDRPLAVAELVAAVARGSVPSGCVADGLTLDKRRTP